MTKDSAHTTHCIEMALTAIRENNQFTLAAEPDIAADRLTLETSAEAIEWLADGLVSCHTPEECL